MVFECTVPGLGGFGAHLATPWYAGNELAVSGTCIILKTSDDAETMIHSPRVGDVLTTADMDEQVIGGSKVLYLWWRFHCMIIR